MVTGNQIRVARFALRWSILGLSEKTGVSVRTIKRIEAEDGVPSTGANTLQELQVVLEAAGIEFIGSPDDRPGIRITSPRSHTD